MKFQTRPSTSGFTLIEVLMASIAGAMVLAMIYGIFTNAIRMRDQATVRTRQSLLRQRAAMIIRNDLLNGYVSGGRLASVLQGSEKGPESHFPGFLKFTTTTGRNADDEMLGNVQQVSYYVVDDPASENRDAGMLVRSADRNLLARVREPGPEQQLLTGVSSLEVAFYDGTSWSSTWNHTASDTTLPQAVRVRLQQVPASHKDPQLPPLEILVPWDAQPLAAASTTTTTEAAATPVAANNTNPDDEETIPAQQEGEIAGEPGEMVGTEGEDPTQSPTPTPGAGGGAP